MCISLMTDRLILRPWKDSDLDQFALMSQNNEVMRYFPELLSRTKSDDLANLIQSFIEKQGWGFWALELKETTEFIGFTGLHHQPEQFDFSPCTEIGWRLKRSAWGQGLAFEAASACLGFGFHQLKLNEIVAFTATQNLPSQKLMLRLGMSKKCDFDHPQIDDHHHLKKHVLYGMTATQFEENIEKNST